MIIETAPIIRRPITALLSSNVELSLEYDTNTPDSDPISDSLT